MSAQHISQNTVIDYTQGETRMSTKPISATFPFESKYLEVNGSNIHYIDEGEGDPILFIHGNPTSSYLWRNIIPYLTPHGRCIALDHIGMGKSDKPDIQYGFESTYDYLEKFIDKLGLKNITLVIHDWGSIMGFHYANMHRDNVKAIAFMEASIQAPNFDGMPFSVKMALRGFRNPLFGALIVKRANLLVKQMLPQLIDRDLTPEELNYYTAPYPDAKSREPLLAWPRDVPIHGQPARTAKVMADYHEFLLASELPKLCFYVTPGVGLQADDVEIVKTQFKNTRVVYLGEGNHFLQEDFPHEIGAEIASWYQTI